MTVEKNGLERKLHGTQGYPELGRGQDDGRSRVAGDGQVVERRWQMWGRTEKGTRLWCELELQTP